MKQKITIFLLAFALTTGFLGCSPRPEDGKMPAEGSQTVTSEEGDAKESAGGNAEDSKEDNAADGAASAAENEAEADKTGAAAGETGADADKEQDATEKPAEDADFTFRCSSNNSWENDGMKAAQFEAVIDNHTQNAGYDWKVVITIPEGSRLENGWNGNYELSGTTLTVTPMDYNSEVAAGGNVSFGFILDTKESFEVKEALLAIGGREYALGQGGGASNSEVNDGSANDGSEDNGSSDDNAADAAAGSAAQETAGSAATETQAGDTAGNTENQNPAKEPAKDIPGESPLAAHGALSIKGLDIVDKNGQAYQLKGVSTHGIGWFPQYVNKEAFADFRKFGANAMRLAMYSDEGAGYCTGGNKGQLEKLIDDGVKACSELGMYVIIDWHVLGECDPMVHKDEAKTFFDMVSKKYADYDNVIYEICNEPNGGVTWDRVKKYAEEVIPVIRANDKTAIIIVGTPTWSQDVDIASKDPVKGFDNIIYAVHFYAATHTDNIRSKVETARKNGIPVIVSECSICDASGNGGIDYAQADKWMKLINDNHMSYFAWNLSNKAETSSLIKSSVSKTGGFTKEDLSETGVWFAQQFGK